MVQRKGELGYRGAVCPQLWMTSLLWSWALWTTSPRPPCPLSSSWLWSMAGNFRRWKERRRERLACLLLLIPAGFAVVWDWFCWLIPLPRCHIHLSSIILPLPCNLRPKGNSTLPTGSLNLILNTSTHLYIESSLVSECVVWTSKGACCNRQVAGARFTHARWSH